VRRIAVRDYPPEIIEARAPLPNTQAAVEAVIANPEDEIRFLAERDGRIIGLACLVMANNELRACYVAPEAARTGVGKALLMKIEETARNAGLKYLYADSSLTAEEFYRSRRPRDVKTGRVITDLSARLRAARWRAECEAGHHPVRLAAV
jgi:putative acetyltransferase